MTSAASFASASANMSLETTLLFFVFGVGEGLNRRGLQSTHVGVTFAFVLLLLGEVMGEEGAVFIGEPSAGEFESVVAIGAVKASPSLAFIFFAPLVRIFSSSSEDG